MNPSTTQNRKSVLRPRNQDETQQSSRLIEKNDDRAQRERESGLTGYDTAPRFASPPTEDGAGFNGGGGNARGAGLDPNLYVKPVENRPGGRWWASIDDGPDHAIHILMQWPTQKPVETGSMVS